MELLAGKTKRQKRILPCIALTLLLCSPAVAVETVDEYGLKAAFLYSFLKFVEWPQAHTSNPYSICILGDDPFGSSIDALVKQQLINGRRIAVRRLKDVQEAKRCHIVFIRSGQKGKAMQLVEAVNGLPVLTVGESADFAATGGLVYFTTIDRNVHININVAAIPDTGLKVSAKLLSLATNSSATLER